MKNRVLLLLSVSALFLTSTMVPQVVEHDVGRTKETSTTTIAEMYPMPSYSITAPEWDTYEYTQVSENAAPEIVAVTFSPNNLPLEARYEKGIRYRENYAFTARCYLTEEKPENRPRDWVIKANSKVNRYSFTT